MKFLAALSKNAAKLLLLYLETGGEGEVRQEVETTGISRTRLYMARDELRKAGLVDNRGMLTWRPARLMQPPAEFEMNRLGVLTQDEMVERVRAREGLPPLTPVVVPEPDNTDLPIRQRAMQADLMDDSGDWSSSNSPRRKRRLAQIKVVQDAWRELGLPGELTSDNAKDFLAWNDDSAEAVLEAFTDLKRRADTGYVKTPLQWLRSKYQRRAKDAPQPQVRPVAVGAPTAADVEESVMLSDYTPATKRTMARLEKLGLLRERSEDE